MELQWAVFLDNELVDLGNRKPAVITCSEAQAIHMCFILGDIGYYQQIEAIPMDHDDPTIWLGSLVCAEPRGPKKRRGAEI